MFGKTPMEAKYRVRLKRTLRREGILFQNDAPTEQLEHLVKRYGLNLIDLRD